MTEVDSMLADNAAELRALCARYSVRQLDLFGSATSTSFDSKNSDLDFLVEFDTPGVGMDLVTQYFGFKEELESLFRRRVDLVERAAIRNAYFLRAIEPQRKVLYAA